jgi:hypothetical protein
MNVWGEKCPGRFFGRFFESDRPYLKGMIDTAVLGEYFAMQICMRKGINGERYF